MFMNRDIAIIEDGGFQSVNQRDNQPKKEILISVDESGDCGPYFREGSSQNFIMAATVTDQKRDFEDISARFPQNTRKTLNPSPGELLYRTSDDDVREGVLVRVASLGVSIYAIILRKDDLPPEWLELDSKTVFRKVTEYLIKEVMSETKGKIKVYFDEQNSYADDVYRSFSDNRFVTSIVEKYADPDRHEIIEVAQKRSVDERALQIHDFVVGGIKSRYVYNEEKPFDVIEHLSKVKEIKR
jgi:hypothetical protein